MTKKQRKWLIIAAVILGVIILLGVLSGFGLLPEFSWQGLTMLFAGLAGPAQYGYNRVRDNMGSETEQVLDKHKEIKKEEVKHREQIDKELKEKEAKIEALDKEIKLIETKIELIEVKRQNVSKEVKQMTTDEKIDEAQNLWGS